MTATPPPGQPATPAEALRWYAAHPSRADPPPWREQLRRWADELDTARATDPGPAIGGRVLEVIAELTRDTDGNDLHPDVNIPVGEYQRVLAEAAEVWADPGPAAPTTYALPADPARPDGLHRKYRVARADGRDKPGGDKAGAAYFVLDYVHDPYARIALAAYAEACAEGYPALAADLRARVPSTVAADLVQPRNPKPASDGDPRVEIAANAIGWELHRDGRPVTDLGDGNESIAVTATETDLARRAARRVVAHLDGYAGRTTADLAEPTPPSTGTTLTVPDSPKMLRETLCAAQVALGEQQLGDRRREHIARLGRLIAECGPLSTGPPAGNAARATDPGPAAPTTLPGEADLLAAIDNALRNGSYMTGANVAFDYLCDRLGVDRDGLRFDPAWVRTTLSTVPTGGVPE